MDDSGGAGSGSHLNPSSTSSSPQQGQGHGHPHPHRHRHRHHHHHQQQHGHASQQQGQLQQQHQQQAPSPYPRFESKLYAITPLDAADDVEVSLQALYGRIQPLVSESVPEAEQLQQLQELVSDSRQSHIDTVTGLLYGVLTVPPSAPRLFSLLTHVTRDNHNAVLMMLQRLVGEKFHHLQDQIISQILWILRHLITPPASPPPEAETLTFCLLRQAAAGDLGPRSLRLMRHLLGVLEAGAAWLEGLSGLLSLALFTFLRLIPDLVVACKAGHSPTLLDLRDMEVAFCVRALRNHFPSACLVIGRDLIRAMQEVSTVPEIEAVWRDLRENPAALGTPLFTDLGQIYSTRTPSRYTVSRVTPEMEVQLRFLLTHVRMGQQRRYQTWFAARFLVAPEADSLVPDLVRFVVCAVHPTNAILQSDVVPRWAVIGWLLKCCRTSHAEANAKLALFYDWLFFIPRLDNIMNIEPAILCMMNSLPKYADLTNSLLDFLFHLLDTYDPQRSDLVLKGLTNSVTVLVTRGVVPSLQPLVTSPHVPSRLKDRLIALFPAFCGRVAPIHEGRGPMQPPQQQMQGQQMQDKAQQGPQPPSPRTPATTPSRSNGAKEESQEGSEVGKEGEVQVSADGEVKGLAAQLQEGESGGMKSEEEVQEVDRGAVKSEAEIEEGQLLGGKEMRDEDQALEEGEESGSISVLHMKEESDSVCREGGEGAVLQVKGEGGEETEEARMDVEAKEASTLVEQQAGELRAGGQTDLSPSLLSDDMMKCLQEVKAAAIVAVKHTQGGGKSGKTGKAGAQRALGAADALPDGESGEGILKNKADGDNASDGNVAGACADVTGEVDGTADSSAVGAWTAVDAKLHAVFQRLLAEVGDNTPVRSIPPSTGCSGKEPHLGGEGEGDELRGDKIASCPRLFARSLLACLEAAGSEGEEDAAVRLFPVVRTLPHAPDIDGGDSHCAEVSSRCEAQSQLQGSESAVRLTAALVIQWAAAAAATPASSGVKGEGLAGIGSNEEGDKEASTEKGAGEEAGAGKDGGNSRTIGEIFGRGRLVASRWAVANGWVERGEEGEGRRAETREGDGSPSAGVKGGRAGDEEDEMVKDNNEKKRKSGESDEAEREEEDGDEEEDDPTAVEGRGASGRGGRVRKRRRKVMDVHQQDDALQTEEERTEEEWSSKKEGGRKQAGVGKGKRKRKGKGGVSSSGGGGIHQAAASSVSRESEMEEENGEEVSEPQSGGSNGEDDEEKQQPADVIKAGEETEQAKDGTEARGMNGVTAKQPGQSEFLALAQVASEWERRGKPFGPWLLCLIAQLGESEDKHREEGGENAGAVRAERWSDVSVNIEGEKKASITAEDRQEGGQEGGKEVGDLIAAGAKGGSGTKKRMRGRGGGRDAGAGDKIPIGGASTTAEEGEDGVDAALIADKGGSEGLARTPVPSYALVGVHNGKRIQAVAALRVYVLMAGCERATGAADGISEKEKEIGAAVSSAVMWERLTSDLQTCLLWSPSLFLRVLSAVLSLLPRLRSSMLAHMSLDKAATEGGGMSPDTSDCRWLRHPLAVPLPLLHALVSAMDPVFAAALAMRIAMQQAVLFGCLPAALCMGEEEEAGKKEGGSAGGNVEGKAGEQGRCREEVGKEGGDRFLRTKQQMKRTRRGGEHIDKEDSERNEDDNTSLDEELHVGKQQQEGNDSVSVWLDGWRQHVVEVMADSKEWESQEQQWLWQFILCEATMWHPKQVVAFVEGMRLVGNGTGSLQVGGRTANGQATLSAADGDTQGVSAEMVLGLQQLLASQHRPSVSLVAAVLTLDPSIFGHLLQAALWTWTTRSTHFTDTMAEVQQQLGTLSESKGSQLPGDMRNCVNSADKGIRHANIAIWVARIKSSGSMHRHRNGVGYS